jgi:HEAT repeat protein
MKRLLFMPLVLVCLGCGEGNDPVALVAQIEAVSKALPNVTPGQIQRAKDAAAQLGRLGAVAVPAMIEGLGSGDRMMRELLAPAFAEIGAPAVAPLTAAAADKNAHRRHGAIEGLFWLMQKKVDISSAVPALKTAVADADALVRRAALTVLNELRIEGTDPLLVAGLKDTDREVRRMAALTLSLRRAAPAAEQAAIPPRFLLRPTELRLIPPAAMPALIALLEDDDQYLQLYAAKALGKFGSAAKAAAPRIAGLMEIHGEQKGVNGFGGYEFAEALVAIGPEAIAPLQGLLQSNKVDVRTRARRALEKLAQAHPAAQEALKAKD